MSRTPGPSTQALEAGRAWLLLGARLLISHPNLPTAPGVGTASGSFPRRGNVAERGFCREPMGSKETCGEHVAATQDSGASGGGGARSRPGQQGCLAAVSRQPDSCGLGGWGGWGGAGVTSPASGDVTLLRNTSEKPPEPDTVCFTGREEPGPGNLSATTAWRTHIPLRASVSTSPVLPCTLQAPSGSGLLAGTEGREGASEQGGHGETSGALRDKPAGEPDPRPLGLSSQGLGKS